MAHPVWVSDAPKDGWAVMYSEEQGAYVPVQLGGTKTATIDYTDTAAKQVFTIPAGSIVHHVSVDVITAFNGSLGDTIDVGDAGNASRFASSVQAGSAGANREIDGLGDIGGSPVDVEVVYNDSAGDATAGQARITMSYLPG